VLTRVKRWLPLLVILILAAGLRFYRLGSQSLWNDEGTTVALVQRDAATIVRNASADIHPPLYYFVLGGWVRLFGTSEASARSLSALAGVALVAVTYLLGRQLLMPGGAILATLLAAIAPLQVYYSQEARMYMWAALLAALSWGAFICLLRRSQNLTRWSWRDALLWLLVSSAAVYSHYVTMMVIAMQSVTVLVAALRQRPFRWRWLLVWIAALLVLVALYIPWLVVAGRSMLGWPDVGARLGSLALMSQFAQVLTWGVTMPPSYLIRVVGWLVLAMALLGPLLVGRQKAWPTLLWLAGTLGFVLVASLWRVFFKDKFLLFVHPAYVLGLAAFIQGCWRYFQSKALARVVPALLLVGLLGVAGVSLGHLYTDPVYQRDDYRGLIAEIQRTAGPDDAILINAPSQIETVGYYHHGPQELVPLPLSRPLDPATVQAQLEELVATHPRIYGLFWATDESDPQRFIETWLDQHTYKAEDRWFGALRLVIYAVPAKLEQTPQVPLEYTLGTQITLRGYTLSTPRLRPGEIAQLTLFWQALAPITGRYKVFVHLVGSNGEIVAQRDSEPSGGAQPTDAWHPEEAVIDRYGIALPADLPPQTLTLRIGMYQMFTLERLQISQQSQALSDHIDLGTIEVIGE